MVAPVEKRYGNSITGFIVYGKDGTTLVPLKLNSDGELVVNLEATTVNIGDVDINSPLGDQHKATSVSIIPADDIPASRQLGKVAIDQSTANANEVVVKSAAPLDLDFSTGGTSTKTPRVKLSNEDIVALVGLLTSSPASISADEDGTARNPIEILKALKNIDIDKAASLVILNNIFGPTAPTPVSISFASGDPQTIIAAPIAGQRIRITSLFLSCAANMTVAMKSASSLIGTIYGLSFAKDWIQPLKLGTAEAFILDAVGADQIYGQICYYVEAV